MTATADTYTIASIDEKNTNIYLHPLAAAKLGCNKSDIITVSFGSGRIDAKLIISDGIAEYQLNLSIPIMEALHLPPYLDYEIRFSDSELILGPFIGLLLSAKSKRINNVRLEKIRLFVNDYANLHGAIVAFDLIGADSNKRLISGYCYNPQTSRFERGVYPYPAAIYRKTGLSGGWKKHFLSAIGNKIFNVPYVGKWRMHKLLASDAGLADYLPHTEVFRKTDRVLQLLETYDKLYIKPLLGLRGHGVLRVSKSNDGWLLELRLDDSNISMRCNGKDEVAAALTQYAAPQQFLIQQGIDLINVNGRLIDFRCIMQKDFEGKWECKAIIARMGVKNSVVSNISNGGRAYRITNLLERIDGLYNWDMTALPERIHELALQVCNTLDDAGAAYGMLGLDIGVDTQGRLWIIEVNNRDPDPSIALNIHDHRLYEELKNNLMRYAKYLAGF